MLLNPEHEDDEDVYHDGEDYGKDGLGKDDDDDNDYLARFAWKMSLLSSSSALLL